MALPTSSRGVTDPEDWAAEALAAADLLNHRLDQETARRHLSSQVEFEASRLGADLLVAASPTGQRLLTNERHQRQRGGARTVLVEGYLLTGTQLLRAARRARGQGAVVVGAVAVSGDPAGVEFVRRELGVPLTVLEPRGS